jgi:hypothetical protein
VDPPSRPPDNPACGWSVHLAPDALQQTADLGRNALRVLIALHDFARADDYCWPSNATIAKKSGLSLRQVQRALPELVEAGWIERDGAPFGGRRKGIRLLRRLDTPQSAAAAAVHPPTKGGASTYQDLVHPPTRTGESHKKKTQGSREKNDDDASLSSSSSTSSGGKEEGTPPEDDDFAYEARCYACAMFGDDFDRKAVTLCREFGEAYVCEALGRYDALPEAKRRKIGNAFGWLKGTCQNLKAEWVPYKPTPKPDPPREPEKAPGNPAGPSQAHSGPIPGPAPEGPPVSYRANWRKMAADMAAAAQGAPS